MQKTNRRPPLSYQSPVQYLEPEACMNTDYFDQRAAGWEQVSQRVRNVDNIARVMRERIRFAESMEIMDFGSGTGLLLERIAPLVGKITAVDTSTAMNEQLAGKRGQLDCELEILNVDLVREGLDRRFDGVISSMTIHHIEDILSLFRTFHGLLNDGGFIAIADLDLEDGSFHSEDAGVFHTGFERDVLLATATEAGFADADISTASVVRKPQRDYPVFLLTARRQGRGGLRPAGAG
jgi:2-polyprenyl-3-methyl-5-hydroxy-6-metoxy-1,4-benzoquinol methylase